MREFDDLKNSIRTVADYPVKGIQFRDITTLLQNKNHFKKMIEGMTDQWKHEKIDAILSIESRGFIMAGALAFNLRKEGDKLGRFWFISLPLASLIFFTGLAVIFDSEYSGEGKYADDSRLLASLCITLYTCLMSFGLIGLFNQVASRGRKWVRYLSDSSYWLYIAHLPLTHYIGYEVKDIDINPYLKLALICAFIFLTLLIKRSAYHEYYRFSLPCTLMLPYQVSRYSERIVPIPLRKRDQGCLASTIVVAL